MSPGMRVGKVCEAVIAVRARALRPGQVRRAGGHGRRGPARRSGRSSRRASARGTVTTASWISCSMPPQRAQRRSGWIVPTPPGWPVPQALSRSSASAPRTSPIGMRSGRRRSDDRTRSDKRRDAVLGAHGDQVRRGALQLARVLDQDDPVAGHGNLGEQRIDQGRLAGAGAARDQDVPREPRPRRAARPPATLT